TEIVDDETLQARAVASLEVRAQSVLELGVGTGETTRRVLAAHPAARAIGIGGKADMLAAVEALQDSDRVRPEQRLLEDPLPDGAYDLMVSVLAVHHLDGPGKADLFRRARAVTAANGAFVLGDLVVPDDPTTAYTPIDGVVDQPSTMGEQLGWL